MSFKMVYDKFQYRSRSKERSAISFKKIRSNY